MKIFVNSVYIHYTCTVYTVIYEVMLMYSIIQYGMQGYTGGLNIAQDFELVYAVLPRDPNMMSFKENRDFVI